MHRSSCNRSWWVRPRPAGSTKVASTSIQPTPPSGPVAVVSYGAGRDGRVRISVVARAYVRRLLTGSTDALGTPKVVGSSGATVVIDGNNAMDQVVAELFVNHAVEKAREHGVGIAVVHGSNHFGTCEYYAMKVSAQRMIGLVATVSSHNLMAPFGGVEALLGNNPLSIAIPTLEAPPLVLDIAMSVAAGGKIRLAAESVTPFHWNGHLMPRATRPPTRKLRLKAPCGQWRGITGTGSA